MGRGALHGVSLGERIRYSKELAFAGDMLPKALIDPRTREVNAGKVLLLVETGQMLGIHPVAAINGINVIEGKPTISPALMTALVRRAGHKVRVSVSGKLSDGTLSATCTVIRSDMPNEPFTSTWDLERAERAELGKIATNDRGMTYFRARSERGATKPWEKYTEAMLKARCTGEACRDAAEEALCGVHYTPEEMGATVDDEGIVIDGGEAETLNPNPPQQTQPQPRHEAAQQAVTPDQVRDAILGAKSRVQLNERLQALDLARPPQEAGQPWQYNPSLKVVEVANAAGEPTNAWDLMAATGRALPQDAPEDESQADPNIVDADVVDDDPQTLPPSSRRAERVGPEDVQPDEDPWATQPAPAPAPSPEDEAWKSQPEEPLPNAQEHGAAAVPAAGLR